MIQKVRYFPKVIKLNKNFRDTLKDWEEYYSKRMYTAPLVGYYVPWLNKVFFRALVPWETHELIRKGTFGVYRGRLKGYTKIFKLKICVYIPSISTKEEYDLISNLQVSSIDEFVNIVNKKPL